jgi:trigger factor
MSLNEGRVMRFEVEKMDSVRRKIVVNVEPEELKNIEKTVLRKHQKSVSIPGFRKGHAPAGLLKRSFGEAIKADVMESAISQYYENLLSQLDFKPISRGEVIHIQFDNVETGLEFHVELEAEPEIELKKYKGLKVEKEIPMVTDEMVEKALAELQESFATTKTVEKSREGHFISFDAQQLGDGDVPMIGQKFEDITVKIGSGEFDPELEKQLIGLETNQEKIIRKIVPPPTDAKDDMPDTEGFKITVKSIEERELPHLDDELAKNLQDDNIETLDQLKDVLRKNIQTNLEQRSLQQFQSRLIDELLKENPFDVPPSMIKHYLEHVVDDLKARYPKEKIDEKLIRERYRADAIHNIRWLLLKDKIEKNENIDVSQEDISRKIDESNYSEEEKKKMKKDARFKSMLKDNMREEKVLKLLEENAEVTEVFSQAAKSQKVSF